MKPEHRIWWEELADQYEEWAENPPQNRWGFEEHTCNALHHSGFGFCDKLSFPHRYLHRVWRDQYGMNKFPAGFIVDLYRDEKRFEFCHYMAETIREALGHVAN